MRIQRTPWLVLALALAACRSNPYGEIPRAEVGTHLDQAEAEIRSGQFASALQRLEAVHKLTDVEPDQRKREERLIDEAARGRFAELQDASPSELEELFDSELPPHVRARAGILAAERMLGEDRRISAYRQVKKVDEALPGHPERVLAGDVVARAGLSLIQDDRRYNLLLHYRPRGVQALEYLVLHYPLEPRCPQAYFLLSQYYEDDRDFDQAIGRCEDLLLYHSESAFAVAASARLPYLRLCRLGRDDYDRGELIKAQGELKAWLERYPDHELAPWVHQVEDECRLRLVRSDLYLAGYYERTHKPVGQRMHAARAEALAEESGLAEEAAAARRLLPPEGEGEFHAGEASSRPPPADPPAKKQP